MKNIRNMTRNEMARVWDLLSQHRGHENAIPRRDAAALLQMSDRRFRDVVKILVEQKKVPIAASQRKPFGYFILIDQDELLLIRNSYFRRAWSTLNRARAYDRSGLVAKLMGQMELELTSLRGAA